MTVEGEQRPRAPGTTHNETKTTFRQEVDRQEEIFLARQDDIEARYPCMDIAVCPGDVFAGRDPGEAVSLARKAHPGKPLYLHISQLVFTTL